MKTFGIILLIMLAVFAIGVGVVFNYTNPPEHVHEYGKWENRTEPTCTEAGVQYRVCECNAEETREVPATGHKFGEWQTKSEPTCDAAGVEYRVCTCGTEETREGAAATGHSFGDWQTRTEPTCDAAGEEYRACACGAEETREGAAATGHSFGDWQTRTEPTCEAAGEEYRACACGKEETNELAAKGHSFGDWATKTPANCTDAEVEYRVCACGKEETREGAAATGHTYTTISASCIAENPMEKITLKASDFTVTATCGCGESVTVTEGITLENSTLVLGTNTVVVNYGELSTTVLVDAAKFNMVIAGTVKDDTYVYSASGSQEKNYVSQPELSANGENFRVLLRYNFSDVIGNEFYAEYRDEAKVQFVYTLTTGSVDDSVKLTFKLYPVSDVRSGADFSVLTWKNYNNNYQFGWGNADGFVEKVAGDPDVTIIDNKIIITLTYREIEKYIDADGNVLAVFAIWKSSTKIGSMENDTEANRPTVNVIFNDDHRHAFIEQVADEKYIASANCEEKAKYYVSCSCGEAGTATFEHGEVIEHSFSEWETKTPANCTDAEVEFRTCHCGKEETQTGDVALGHDMQTKYDESYHWTKCSRCDEATDGVAHFGGTATETEQAICEGCGQPYGGLATHEHSFGEWESFSPATCDKDEVLIHYCDCGVSETSKGAAAFGHDMQTKFDENNHWTECAHNCGASTEAVAHFGGEATETEQAICEGCNQPYGEFKPAEKKEYTINGVVVADTDINSSSKDRDRSANEQMYLYSSNARGFAIIDLSEILDSADFEQFKADGKFYITFAIAGNESDINKTKFTLQAAKPTYTDANGAIQYTAGISASAMTWNSTHTSAGAYYNALYLGNMDYIIGNKDSGKSISGTDKIVYTSSEDGACGYVSFVLTYDDIKDNICMDTASEYYGQVVFKIRAKGSATSTSGTLYFATTETDTPPTVKFVYEK